MNTFETMAQVAMAFVGFATIVITVHLGTGARLTPYQRLLTHFYVEVGFLAAALALVPLGLVELYGPTETTWRVSTYVCLFAVCTYLPLYLHRRSKIEAPTPLLSVFVIAGYFMSVVLLGLTATGWFWQPTAGMVTGFVYWTMFSCGIIFVGMFDEFLGDHVERANLVALPLTTSVTPPPVAPVRRPVPDDASVD